jgi:hypothetical protein
MRTNRLLFLALLALGALLIGCESDSTAPDEDLPALESGDVATQSGAMATSMTRVLPRIWSPGVGKAVGEYSYTFVSGPVLGTVFSEFRTEEGGELVGYDVAGWCRVFTDEPLAITLVEGGIPWLLDFSVTADIDQQQDQATASGGGTLTVGAYVADFTLDAVVVRDGDSYPASGSITFVNEGVTATVAFDGDATAVITVGDESWVVDLDDASVSG